jgi:hypothetical protein
MTTPTGPGITTPVQIPSYLGSVRQQNPVGQNLSANPNVNAPAGYGGDLWGANGGGITAIGGGATDQTGFVKPAVITPSSCETASNFLDSAPLGTVNRPTPGTRLGQMNSDALSGQTQEPLSSVGNNAG